MLARASRRRARRMAGLGEDIARRWGCEWAWWEQEGICIFVRFS